MPRTTSRRVARVSGLVVGLALIAGLLPRGVVAATWFRMDLFYKGGYERQIDDRTCTAASTSMMLAFIARRNLGLGQFTILRFAQRHDALKDSRQRGSDPLGWSRALTYYGTRTGQTFSYAVETFTSQYAALKRAAQQIALTGKPVGLAIWHGHHAVVMTGFDSTADPRNGDFTLLSIWVSDPSGRSHHRYAVARNPLDRYLQRDASRYYDRAWYKKYVIVAPQLTTPPPNPTPTPTPDPTPTPSPDPTPTPPPSPDPTSTPDPTASEAVSP